MNKTDRARWDDALRFAATMHGSQMRKGTSLPYITHPIGVAELLGRYYPTNSDLAIAGLLHDTVEDTAATSEQIRSLFGPAVAALVDGVTKRDGANWRETRQMQIDKIASVELDVVRLKLADAMHNASSVLADLRSEGPAVWKRFRATPADVCWYYGGLLTAIHARLGSEPLVSAYGTVVAELARRRA